MGGICAPSLQSVMVGYVPANEQGELQGSLTALMSATTIIGPPLMTSTFAFFTSKSAPFYFAGSAFLLGAIFMIASAVVAYYVLHVKPARAKV